MDGRPRSLEATPRAVPQRWLQLALGAGSRGSEPIHSGPCGPGTLFWNFSEGVLAELLWSLDHRHVSAGSRVFDQDSLADQVFLVVAGSLQLELLREELELGLDVSTRPKPPVDEVVALEGPLPTGRSTGLACDFVLEEPPVSLRSSKMAHPKLLKSLTSVALPTQSTREQSPRSQAPAVKEKPLAAVTPLCTMTPREALLRDDRLLRPVADVVRALAASQPPGSVPEETKFQQKWQQFQAHLGSLVEAGESKAKARGARSMPAPPPHPVQEEPPPAEPVKEAEPWDVREAKEPQPSREEAPEVILPRKRQKQVAVAKEMAGPGAIVGAVACLGAQNHKWTAVAAEDTELLALSASSLRRAVKRELSHRYAERGENLLSALGQLRSMEEEKLRQLAVASKSVLYRRGEVLCWEGDVRSHQSRLEVLMLGEARRLRASVEDVSSMSTKEGPKLTRARSMRSMASLQNAGSLLPGQVVNATSLFTDCGEPFTVVVESAELLSLSLALSDLVRWLPGYMLEELKAWASQRLSWHRTQIAKLFQEVKAQAECVSPRSSSSTKLSALPRMDGVLHDRPELVCKKSKQPPGASQDDGHDLLTSTLAIHMRPDPLLAECPTVHESLIPHMRGHAKPPDSPKSQFTAGEDLTTPLLLTSSSNLWDPPAAEMLEKVMRTCEDWGLRKLSAAAAKLSKRDSLNSQLKFRRKERLEVRGSTCDVMEVRPIEPMLIAKCSVPHSSDSSGGGGAKPISPMPTLPVAVKEVLKAPFGRGSRARPVRRASTLRRGGQIAPREVNSFEDLHLGKSQDEAPAQARPTRPVGPMLDVLPSATEAAGHQRASVLDHLHVRGIDHLFGPSGLARGSGQSSHGPGSRRRQLRLSRG